MCSDKRAHSFETRPTTRIRADIKSLQTRIVFLAGKRTPCKQASTYQGFGQSRQTRSFNLVITQIQDFQRPIPLEHLSDICHAILLVSEPHCYVLPRLTLISLPFKSSVKSRPIRSTPSRALTLRCKAILADPEPTILPSAGVRLTPPSKLSTELLLGKYPSGIVRLVIPPEEVTLGIGGREGSSALGSGIG